MTDPADDYFTRELDFVGFLGALAEQEGRRTFVIVYPRGADGSLYLASLAGELGAIEMASEATEPNDEVRGVAALPVGPGGCVYLRAAAYDRGGETDLGLFARFGDVEIEVRPKDW
jgi:hypothetical protein